MVVAHVNVGKKFKSDTPTEVVLAELPIAPVAVAPIAYTVGTAAAFNCPETESQMKGAEKVKLVFTEDVTVNALLLDT